MDKSQRNFIIFLLAIIVAVFVWSGIGPRDRFTWFLEVLPVLIAVPLLACTYKRFTFTRLAYGLMVFFMVILMVGGKYTYAEMPLFNWLRDTFDLSRNHYDRCGHFMQGFVPAIVIREVLLRTSPLKSGGWLFTLTTSMCLAISACYELFEWATAVFSGDASIDFLGSQGDIWDAQWDMFLAFIGAMIAQLLLARFHNRQIEKMVEGKGSEGWSPHSFTCWV